MFEIIAADRAWARALVGLLFAWAMASVSGVDSTPYFVQSDVGGGDRVSVSVGGLVGRRRTA